MPHAASPNSRQNSRQHSPRSTLLLANSLAIHVRVIWSTSTKSSSSDYKGELGDVCADVLSLMVDESGNLNTMVLKMDQEIFNMSLETKRLLYDPGHAPEVTAPTAETRGVKLIHQTHI